MTIYYEYGFPAELVPVEFIGWAEAPLRGNGFVNAVVRLKRKPISGIYKCGDVLHVPAYSIVEKAGSANYHQLVRRAELPAIDYNNLIHGETVQIMVGQ